ncbi:MAG: esterase/lipase family protein [Acidimicrobiia bacterium]
MRTRIKPLVTVTAIALSLFPVPATAADLGPPLKESPEALAKTLSCPATFKGDHEPVLLVHGTAGTPEAWSWNYVKVLSSMGYDACAVALPDYARADMQVSSEYVVHAIRWMAQQSDKKVDVIGFSQGPLEPRWALKWWPDIREKVDDMVAMAGVSHGFTETEVICSQSCIAPFWQMKPGSKFLAALNAGDETPGDVSYTSVYSRTDQFVWLMGAGGDPWTESSQLEGASNIAIQDICPGRFGEHFQALYDAVYFAVISDALANRGPADPARVDRAVCLQGAMPGVDMGEAAVKSVGLHQDLYTRTGEHHVTSEPSLAAYAS